MTRPLYDMFNSVPRNYDLINTLMTWGLDKGWRRTAAEKCLGTSPARILDICCGTGDFSYLLSILGSGQNELVALDFSPLMLGEAKRKFSGLQNRPAIINGDASALPFTDACFDCIGISFAFRNLTYRNPKISQHLSEIFRILKPDGRFVIVESSQPESAFIRKLFHLYLKLYVSPIGTLVSGNKGAYNYLAVSTSRFYMPGEVRELLLNTGFTSVEYKAFLFGAAGVHMAVK
ncbi:MAG: ubiquinone/menaquinone biosynthesis methyltransferase [Dehalococcoidales bacterium]|nr:ubiquinone/menaquinone biosynthesis methyltransferase [Dehalococcoidales bacterium]